jgi:hypothetical protein
MPLSLKYLRGYWSIPEVGEQHYDHHKRVATEIRHQVNRLLGYRVRCSQSRIVQLPEYNMGDLLTRGPKLKSH